MATSVADQIRQLERMYGDNKYPQPIGTQNAANGGMNRLPLSVPNAVPRVLPLGVPEDFNDKQKKGIPLPPPGTPSPNRQNTPPVQKTPIPLPQTVTPSPVSSRPSNPTAPPNLPPSLGQRVTSGVTRVTDGASRAAGVVQVTASIANAVQNRSTRNTVNAGLDIASTVLFSVPNPYAQGAALLLQAGKLLYNIFTPPENITQNPDVLPLSFTGGQSPGVSYHINYRAIYTYSNLPNDRYYVDLSENFTGVLGGIIWKDLGRNLQVFKIVDGVEQAGFDIDNGSANPVNRAIGIGFDNIVITRNDGLPDTGGDLSPSPDFVPSQNQDGYSKPDFDKAFDDLRDRFSDVDSNLDSIKDLVESLKQNQLPRANNGITPIAPNRIPKPLPMPKLTPDAEKISKPVSTPNRENVPQGLKAPQPSATPNNQPNRAPQPNTAPKTEPKTNTSPQTKPDRFKDPKDCQFSCSALADCFSDLTVQIFDGCDPTTGQAKTKDLTIQVLPKDKAKTSANFQELLDIRSRECSLNDKVVTIPEYWQLRVNQIPQAVILYREFLNNKFTDTYYSSHIPHYTGNKNSKPRLTQYDKGEHSAIYVCKDNSKLVVYGKSEQEAKRIINEMERYINPRLRGDIVKLGTRKGIKETTVKPIRLDFFSTGQIKLAPDWSIHL